MNIIPVILSGGSGVRLWPLSRKHYPKQYLSLLGNKTMLQETILRLKGLDNVEDPIIICNTDHRFLVYEQCKEINVINPTILLEPVGRNTAPAIVAAAFQSIKHSDNSTLLVLPADHVIQDIKVFYKAINTALKQIECNKLVTFGIIPTDINTNYGYIKLSKRDSNSVCNVEEFVEKPNLQKAKSYIEKGNYLWNSGMFMFSAKIMIDELSVYSPDIVNAVRCSVENSILDFNFIFLERQSFESSPNDSIDCALMEKSTSLVVVPLDAGWSDIGSWSALYDIGIKDEYNNLVKGDAIVRDTTNTFINANNRMVVTIGVDNLIVVDTPDVTLITTQEKSLKVKEIASSLKNNMDEYVVQGKVYRPWGWFESIESGAHFQVKKIRVNPGAKLSLQMHYKRAEHWVVVSGIVTVTNGKEVFTLNKGESTYIPLGVIHSLENMTNEPAEVIEVQSGVYLGEDDIVRFEDIYGRETKKLRP